jgi:membrane-associated protease RseP (regulator of RpoE activity)
MFAGFVEPDEEEFNKAKKISKLRVIGAGATANVIFAFVLGAILLTNPLFALIMPEPLLSTFYELPQGVLILSIIEESGAEQAGLLANDIITSASPEDPERGLIGIMRDNSLAYKPVFNVIEWNDPGVSMFLLWLWMISFFIGIINMLPLPILDGGKFIHTIIDQRISEKAVNGIMWTIYGFTFALFGLNIALSYIKSGWFTI